MLLPQSSPRHLSSINNINHQPSSLRSALLAGAKLLFLLMEAFRWQPESQSEIIEKRHDSAKLQAHAGAVAYGGGGCSCPCNCMNSCWSTIISLPALFSSNRENTRRGPETRAKMHWKRLSIQWNLVRSSC